MDGVSGQQLGVLCRGSGGRGSREWDGVSGQRLGVLCRRKVGLGGSFSCVRDSGTLHRREKVLQMGRCVKWDSG